MIAFLTDPEIQRTLTWFGGGLVTIAAGIWVVIKHLSSRKSGSAGSQSARVTTGIAATGDVKVGRDVRITSGVPVWVFALGLFGLILVVLGLLLRPSALSPEEISKALSGARFEFRNVDGLPVVIELQAGGMAAATSLRPDVLTVGNGIWRITDAGEVCLDMPFALAGGGFVQCLTPERDRNDLGLEPLAGAAVSAPRKLPALGAVAPQDLAGQWHAYGYSCPTGTFHNEIVTLAASTNGLLTATKDVGDPCVPAGNVTWEGRLQGLRIDGRFRVGSPQNPASDWVDDDLFVLSPDHIVSDGKIGGRVVFIRSR